MNQEIVRFGFVLPHWFFWGLLIVFPLVYLWLAKLIHRHQPEGQTFDEQMDEGWNPPGNGFTKFTDRLCRKIGYVACLWTIPAIFYYCFEVMGRYFFNAPTNWVHEACFLMFGMMYTLGGAALYLANGHVRVDVFYAKWSRRGRAAADMITFPIFSVFVLAILFTGWRFFSNSLDQNYLPDWIARGVQFDISQTEWAIAYWPVKGVIPLAALLVFLQGLSRFVKDFQTYKHFSEAENE